MKNTLVPLLACMAVLMFACKSTDKKEEGKDTGSFIPAVSIIRNQLNAIDSSLNSIIKVTYRDTMFTDTEYIKRENVRDLAGDFLSIPELSKKDYKEESIPGPTDRLSTILYTPVKDAKTEIQRLEFVIDPNLSETGQNVVHSIYIDRGISNRDSSVQKKLLWRIDQSFQVTTIQQKKGGPETTTTYKVIWNEDDK